VRTGPFLFTNGLSLVLFPFPFPFPASPHT
jgi:hypothetical protein